MYCFTFSVAGVIKKIDDVCSSVCMF